MSAREVAEPVGAGMGALALTSGGTSLAAAAAWTFAWAFVGDLAPPVVACGEGAEFASGGASEDSADAAATEASIEALGAFGAS